MRKIIKTTDGGDNMLTNKKWIGLFAVTGAMLIISVLLDNQLAKLFYFSSNPFGVFCVNVVPSLALFICCFAAVSLMMNRNSHATRTKTRVTNAMYLILGFAFSFAGGYYPFRNVTVKPYLIIAAIAVGATGLLIYLNYALFKNTYQKIAITRVSKAVIISALIIAAICFAASLLPQRVSYAGLQTALSSYADPNDTTGLLRTPYIAFPTAAGAMVIWANALVAVIPKLKFSSNMVFALTIIWIFLVAIGSVTSGEVYASSAAGGVLAAICVIFAISKISEKKDN
jgi:hypothetical protein